MKVKDKRQHRKIRIRKKINGTDSVPRLAVFKSNNNIYVQAIDDLNQVKLQGIMGDPSLIQNVSKSINMKSLTKWISVFNTPLRRHLAKRYLINLHDHYFENLDSSKKELLIELSKVKLKLSMLWITDVYDLLYCYFNIKLKPYLFFSKEYKWVKSKKIN